MSARATFWAWRVGKKFDLSSTERLVLLRLADGSSEETGECWYKQESIAEATGLSRSGVQKALYSLAERGLLKIERVTAEGRTLANTYRLVLTMEAPLPTTDAPVPLSEEGIPGKHRGASDVSSLDPSSKTDPDLIKRERARGRRKAKPSTEPLPDLPASVNTPKIVEVWNAFVEMRRQKGKACIVTPLAAASLFKKFEIWGPDKTHALISRSIEQNYRGVFDDEKIPNAPRRAEVAPPPSPPVDRALEEAKDAAIAQIRSTVLTAADGWHGSARSLIETLIQDAPDVATISAICPAALALDGRLRTLGAYPLRRPGVHDDWEPGILLSKSGSKWRVTWNGESFEVVAVLDRLDEWSAVCPILDKLALPINCPEGCADGGPCKSWPEPCPRQFEDARECECEACATGDGPCRETIASALAFCMDESFGDGPTTQVANKRSRAVVDQEDSAARKHEATQVFANKAVESYSGPARYYVDNAGLRHCPRGGYHRPSFSDGGLLRCSNCKTSLTEAWFDNRLCPGGLTPPSETGHHECAITIDDPANPSPEAVEAAYSRVAVLRADPRVKTSPGGVLGIPRPPTPREIEYGQRLAAEVEGSRPRVGLSSAELAAIDPPNPDFFGAVSRLPPLDVSGLDDNPDFGNGEGMVGDDTPLEDLAFSTSSGFSHPQGIGPPQNSRGGVSRRGPLPEGWRR